MNNEKVKLLLELIKIQGGLLGLNGADLSGKLLNLGKSLGHDGLEFVEGELLNFNGSVNSSQKV